MSQQPVPSPLSHFWAPLCAVGSHGRWGPNAQICLAIIGASIVPERPRLLVGLWKTNLTHDLVAESGSMAITLLSADQAHLLWPLGIRSGRDGPKLQGLRYLLTPAGDPWFEGAAAMRCEVLDAFDVGDATFFLVAVREFLHESPATPLTWPHARQLLGPRFLADWEAKAAANRQRAAPLMRWVDGD